MDDATDILGGLFNGPRYQETCFGYMTDEQYQQRLEYERAKFQAKFSCDLCDGDGYRGLVVCDHVDRSQVGAKARRESQKRRFRVINGNQKEGPAK